ncbi:TetR family transcriptional regulator [Actinomadura sp. LD22]|uniref:TetR family transcriptional regulator n=1 Tax=Actinomadura physcomitrii TaxID=2650748 RepID=A0A6I4MB43_9ACTN|nr:TetR family transcriptional regulator [Actinomadura physcomitrii]MWA01625.1 TetR family transcriptional regulator [Actinomadura physcomitrii]
MTKAFLRARRPEHKQQRRAAILDAARELAIRSGVREVSLGGVAEAAGMAKSNLARYFATREEIYLELAAQEWKDWERAVLDRLAGSPAPDTLIDTLTGTLAERPLFCELLSHTVTTLEHNVTIEAARRFKLVTLDVQFTLAKAVAQACPEFTGNEARELVAAAAALASLLYPAANPPPVIAELYDREPALAAAAGVPFEPAMKRMLTAIAAGLPTLR